MSINLIYQPGTGGCTLPVDATDEDRIEDAEKRLRGEHDSYASWGDTIEALDKARAEQGPDQQFTIEFGADTTITSDEVNDLDLSGVTLQGNGDGPHILMIEPDVMIRNARILGPDIQFTSALRAAPPGRPASTAPKPSPKYRGSNQRQRRRNRRRG